jgi:fatty-acyl-CoA synthase
MAGLRTLPEALTAAARTAAGFCFVSGGTDRWRSYADILQGSMRVARSLREAGLRRGDLAALVLPDGERFLEALFGSSIAGITPASLYPPPTTTGELSRYFDVTAAILRASGARAVVSTRALAPSFERVRPLCPDLSLVLCSEDLDATALEPEVWPALDDIAFVQFTSGSASMPKGVALTHANLAANIEAFGGPSAVAITPHDIGVSWLPLNHDMGLVGMALGALYAGRPCVLLPPHAFVKRPAEWLRAITRHRGTVSFAPAFAYDLCVRRVKDLDELDLSSWRVAGCGAEPIHPGTLAAFAEKFARAGFRETSFLPCYGLAEHVVAATIGPPGRRPRSECIAADEFVASRIAVAHAGGPGTSLSLVSCGSALPGHRLRVAAEDGGPLPERHVGQILLAGPSVMHSYYKERALTAETIRDGWLHTGDLGFLSEGELFVCGRAKDLIIVHGRKYHPQDLERAVDRLGGVRRGRVVAFGVSCGAAEHVVIVVEPTGTVPAEVLTDAIRREIGDLFGLYVDDVALVASGTVGRTTSGKVQRAATRTRYERGELTEGKGGREGQVG